MATVLPTDTPALRIRGARTHNLPAFVVFLDATLAQMAREQPVSLDALSGVSGVGEKKLRDYGEQILQQVGSGAVFVWYGWGR